MAFAVEAWVLLLCVVGYLLYRLGTRNRYYWQTRGVPVLDEWTPFIGTQRSTLFMRESTAAFLRRVYDAFPSDPYVGLLQGSKPTLFVRDPELVKHILLKDFEYFPDRGMPYNEKDDFISAHLFNLEGVRWKNLRIKLTPTFTTGKIKRMFPLMQECGRELSSVLEAAAAKGDVELKDILGRFSTDVIGTCAFGITCNSLRDPNAEFRLRSMDIFKMKLSMIFWIILFAITENKRLLPNISKEDFGQFFTRVIRENIQYREEKHVKRGDFLDLLIELKNKGSIVDDTVDTIEDPFLRMPVSTTSEEFKFDYNILTAQAFVFFFAGFETSSTIMAFCLLELAYNQDVQRMLQSEIDAVLLKHKEFSYEALSEMHYMDKVISETLRKYPPLSFLTRKTIKPYKVPGSDLVLDAATTVFIPVYGLHNDPAVYPDPDRFDPERFSAEAKASRHPYTYLPFGEGPRNCIGMRFGLLQTKLGLASVLSRCSVEPSPRTQYPVRFLKMYIFTAPADACNLVVKERFPKTEG